MVQMPSVTLPVAGTISTYTPLLGFDGVIGVKSGFTTAAGGCDVLAVEQTSTGSRPCCWPPSRGRPASMCWPRPGLHGLALVNASARWSAPRRSSTGAARGARQRGGQDGRRHVASSASVLTWPGVTVTADLPSGAAT